MALLTEPQAYDLCAEFNVVVERKGKLYELWDDQGYTLLAVLPKEDFESTDVLGRHLYGHVFDLGREQSKMQLRRSINELLGLV
jgi:hypothetical protein